MQFKYVRYTYTWTGPIAYIIKYEFTHKTKHIITKQITKKSVAYSIPYTALSSEIFMANADQYAALHNLCRTDGIWTILLK